MTGHSTLLLALKAEEEGHTKELLQSLGTASGPSLTASKETGAQSYNHIEHTVA